MLVIAELALGLALVTQPASAATDAGPLAPERPGLMLAQQYEVTPRGYRGQGQNFGADWENDRRGNVRGSGRNFGGGFETDRRRRTITGTGSRFGGGYDIQSGGRRVVGTGNNFGKGWERQGNEWVGTGGNFGKRCPARPGSSFVPCM